MLGRIVKISIWVSLVAPIGYLAQSCYHEKQDIRIDQINQPKNWIYDITTVPLGERMYYVLIDGELNSDATLESQTQRTTSNLNKPDTTYINSGTMRLPKGKFSMYYNRDDSGPEKFVYHPLEATKGWVRVQIIPGSWNHKDSSRSHPDYVNSKLAFLK